MTWKKFGAASLVPLALAAVHTSGWAAERVDDAGATWSFHHENVLGTSLEIRIRAHDLAAAQRAEDAALAEFDRQESILSGWRADSELSRWAASRFVETPVSPELFRTLAQFDFWREKTSGALDASAEAAARLWRDASAAGRTPDEPEIAQTVEAMQQPHWSLDATRQTATRLTDVPLAFATFAKSAIASSAADAALASGATGIMLNAGGDVIVRGAFTQLVSIADPRASAENDPSLEHIVVRNRAVATSGSYRRGLDFGRQLSSRAPELSHILDPRTAMPTGHVLSSTVIAPDAETAGALATAFSVLAPEESAALAKGIPGVDYFLVTRDGGTLRSAGFDNYAVPTLRSAAYRPAAAQAGRNAAAAGTWNPMFELEIALELPRFENYRARRPYVAVWVEDANHFPIRTIALWTEKPRFIKELSVWFKDDRMRASAEGGTEIYRTIASATRPPGQYTVKWDGKDNEGKLVKAGTYTICIEAAREHGGYQFDHHELTVNSQPQQFTFQPGPELGTVTLDYHKH
jgi:thiamine biosynthesis lipoprotein